MKNRSENNELYKIKKNRIEGESVDYKSKENQDFQEKFIFRSFLISSWTLRDSRKAIESEKLISIKARRLKAV